MNQEEKRDDEEATTSGMAIGPRVPTLPCLVKNIVEDAIEVLIFEDRCSTNGYNNENRSPNAKGNDSASAEDPKPAAVFPSSLERYNVDSAANENPRKPNETFGTISWQVGPNGLRGRSARTVRADRSVRSRRVLRVSWLFFVMSWFRTK